MDVMETGSLERSFRQIRNDLSSTAHRLDITFDDAIEGGSSTHPLKLMRRVQALEELTKSVAAEWKEIEARRQELIPKVCLSTLYSQISLTVNYQVSQHGLSASA